MSKEAFRDRFGDDPRKDDLTVLAPKQDDPTEQVTASLQSSATPPSEYVAFAQVLSEVNILHAALTDSSSQLPASCRHSCNHTGLSPIRE